MTFPLNDPTFGFPQPTAVGASIKPKTATHSSNDSLTRLQLVFTTGLQGLEATLTSLRQPQPNLQVEN